ncbi:MAG TPA: flagellar hook-length control protein FliK [Bradyrhizobium sp.]|nr:flagellar hook-length control protein FliK [Bradyrhizobium sp.]
MAAQAGTNAAAAASLAQQKTPTGTATTSSTSDGALAASVAATAPVAAKTTSGKTQAAVSDKQDSATTTTSTETANNNLAQQPTDAPATGNGPADAAKADAGIAVSANPSARDHQGITDANLAPANSSGTGAQATGSFAQLLPTTVTPAAAAPVSVSAATNAAVPLSGLAVEIAASARGGKSQFDIRLDPAELGRIDVSISVDSTGQVTSHLTVEKPETLTMLQQDAPQLQQALDDAGFKTGSGGLQFSLRDQSSSGQNSGNQSGGNAHRLIVSDEDTMPAAIAGRTYGRMLGSSSGVDIRV